MECEVAFPWLSALELPAGGGCADWAVAEVRCGAGLGSGSCGTGAEACLAGGPSGRKVGGIPLLTRLGLLCGLTGY